MAMRSQIYEWTNLSTSGSTSSIRMTTDPFEKTVSGDKKTDIFIGGIGTNITKPAETTATQFVVIEDIATSAHANSAVQVRINTTDYFQNPDITDQVGVPGLASPYPRGTASDGASSPQAGDNVLPSFSLTPEIYVLPGQTYSVLYTANQSAAITAYGGTGAGQTTPTTAVACFVKYTLYDGPDSLIANRLLEMGITVNPGNVDWYKRSLLSRASAPAPANGA